ncbi:LysR substrate-binding domain-containing protein [Hydrogenophaga sp.]|uniref:LysR family transcriptional regulator n=1 Tax=Hydrogenophaga sp. TaxID=1904254 RepID=UPI003F70DA70
MNDTLVFVRVAQAGSFSAAARLMGMPVSTISVRVSRLEQRLGVTLLQRTTRRLRLTEAGQAYLQQAARGLEEIAQAEAQIDAGRHEAQGLLRITLPIDMGDEQLLEILGTYRARHPGVSVELVFSDARLDLVEQGLDVALRAGELADSSLVARQIGQARWAPFAHPDYLQRAPAVRHPRDLSQHAALCFSPLGRESWTLMRGKTRVNVPLQSAFAANDMRMIRRLALDAQGVALLPDYVCHREVDHGHLVPLLPGWYARTDPIHLVYPSQRYVPAKLRHFIDEVAPALSSLFER